MREKATLFYRGLQRLLFCGLLVGALIFAACNKTPGSQGNGYTVTFSVEGDNGTLTAQVGRNTIPHSPIKGLSAGSKVMFTAIPSSGYTVQQWTENKKPVNSTNTSYTLVVKDSSSVTVQFMKAEKSAPQPPNDQPPASAVKHKVMITDITNGSVTAVPALPADGMVAEGSEIKFTANANEGYQINEWKVPGGTIIAGGVAGTPTATVKITADTTVSVSFIEKDKPLTAYKVNFSADTTKGSLTATLEGKTISSGDSVISGKDVMFTAEPKDGYMLTSWKVNDATVSGTDLTRTIRIEKDTTVSAIFEKYYKVTLGNIEHGKLSVSPELKKDGKVAENRVLTFTATPDEGYEVDAWTVSDGSFEAGTGTVGQTEAKLKVTKDVTVGVSFKIKTFKVTHSADSGSPGLTLQVEYEGRPGVFLTSPIENVPYGTKLLFKAETNESSVESGLVPEWTITGSTATEGGKRRDPTAIVPITDTTTVTVKLVPFSAKELLDLLKPEPPKTVTEDFFLKTNFAGQTITWKSSDETVIKIGSNDPHSSKVQASVTRDIVDRKVTLTAALTQGTETARREFNVTVKVLEEVTIQPANLTCEFVDGQLTVHNKARYRVTAIDPAQKTLTANLTHLYRDGMLKTLEALKKKDLENAEKDAPENQKAQEKKKIEDFYTFKARSVLYTYTLAKTSDNNYTITIESKYDTEKPWYEQKGSYETANDDYVLSIDEQQPPPTLIIKTKDGKEYQCPLSEVKNNGSFTAKVGSESVTVTVDDSQKNGTLTVTIGSTPYTASFKSVNMQ